MVTGGDNKSPEEECRSLTEEAATINTGFYITLLVLVGLVFIKVLLDVPVQGPSNEDKEARKGLKGETVS